MSVETNPEVLAALKLLREHYREPVMPVSTYCNALRDWGRALVEASHDAEWRKRHERDLLPIANMAHAISLAIAKSCLLDRLIYGGEKLRTEKCEHHQGTWSGCSYPSQPDITIGDRTIKKWCDDCHFGSNITGWKRHQDGSSDASRGPFFVTLQSEEDAQ